MSNYVEWLTNPEGDFPQNTSFVMDIGALVSMGEHVYTDLQPVLQAFYDGLDKVLGSHGWTTSIHGRDLTHFLVLTGPREQVTKRTITTS